MIIKVCGATDIGKRRDLNEDSFGIHGFEENVSKGLCVLADGMGGHNAGEVASSIAVESVIDKLAATIDETDDNMIVSNITDAIDFANTSIYEMSLKNREQAGMGTTLVVVYVVDNHVRIANIGDSRAYAISDKEINRITVDHSIVEELVQRGTITREEARNHPDKNIITRALGTDAFVEADYFDYTPIAGETILMCSDGLTEMVCEERIQEIICRTANIDETVNDLIEEANKNGGVDNITVIAIHFDAEEADGHDLDR